MPLRFFLDGYKTAVCACGRRGEGPRSGAGIFPNGQKVTRRRPLSFSK